MSLGLFMIRVLAATSTKLTELQPVRRGLLILGRDVVAVLAFSALKHDVVAWHIYIPDLINDFRNRAGAYRPTTFTNCEA